MRVTRGFTLIELLTVLAVAAILALVAAPSFVRGTASRRLSTAATNLQSALMAGRSESIKRNASVRVQPVTGTEWATGWKVVEVASNATLVTYPAAATLSITGPTSLTYQGTGRPSTGADASFRLAGEQASSAKCVVVGATGLAAITGSGC